MDTKEQGPQTGKAEGKEAVRGMSIQLPTRRASQGKDGSGNGGGKAGSPAPKAAINRAQSKRSATAMPLSTANSFRNCTIFDYSNAKMRRSGYGAATRKD